MDYQEFLDRKQILDSPSGFISQFKFNSALFNWQKVLVDWTLKRGRAAIFASCGMGKTIIQLEWARHIYRKTKSPILILAPLAVTLQTQKEGKKFHIPVNICESQLDVKNGINITNYEKLHKFNPSKFIGVVLDECFPPDTPIEFFNIDNCLELKYIKDLKIGDRIINAGGVDYVCNICKRQINRAIQINVNGKRITCSENHPFFTLQGWKCAKDLQTGDNLLATEEAMRLVWGNFSTEIYSKQEGKILREILLSEMEDVNSRVSCKSTQSESGKKKRIKKISVVEKWKSKSIEGVRKNSKFKSNERPGSKKKSIIYTSKNEPQTSDPRREWSETTIYSSGNEKCFIKRLDYGISNIIRKIKKLSNMLQSRFRKSTFKNSNRSRWIFPLFLSQKETGQKKRGKISSFRMEGIEILEQGNPKLERYRDEKGIIYFYDLKIKRHPSFSINGILVHNSSILKNQTGIRRNQIIESFQSTPYRLACTATPAPNDYEELGNHAEFLGIMTRTEMLSMFFINDTLNTKNAWKLKGHVKNNIFWEWIASWAVMISKPSDIGFSDEGFILPKIYYHEHILKSKVKPSYGLFFKEAQTMEDRRKVRKSTIELRCRDAASLINCSNKKWVIWCNLNDEGDCLEKLIEKSVQVAGKHSDEIKAQRMLDFANGKIEKIVTKPKIAGLGMNWQICSCAAFVGLSDSFEQFYQAVRRIWRFGQKEEVHIHIFLEEREGAVLKNIQRKDKQAKLMIQNMIKYMKELTKKELGQSSKETMEYNPQMIMELPKWIKV